MDFVRRILATEPILITRFAASAAALAASAGFQVGDAEVNAAVDSILQLVAIGNMVLAFVDRAGVFSPKTHEADVAAAREAGVREGYQTYGGIDYK